MATATWIKNMLTQRGVAYEELRHRLAFTAQEVAESEHISGHRLAKVVVVLADGRPVELIMPASRRVVLKQVQALLGAKHLRLASEDEMDKIFTDCETGAIPPLRHWKDVEVMIDSSMPTTGDLVFQAGTHEDAIRLDARSWLALVGARTESFTELEHASCRPTFADREDQGASEWVGPERALAEELKRESGLPGGGKGRIEVVECSGVYPGSGPFPAGDVQMRTPGEWVKGQRDDEGREVEGGSGLIYLNEQVLLGGASPPSSSPRPADPEAPKHSP